MLLAVCCRLLVIEKNLDWGRWSQLQVSATLISAEDSLKEAIPKEVSLKEATPKKTSLKKRTLKLFFTLRRFLAKAQPFQHFLHRNKATENVVFCYAKQQGFAAVQIF